MTKSITIRIDEDDKERWKEHADEKTEFDSVTHLIKSCVEREIARSIESPNEKNPLRLISDVIEEVEKNRSEIQTVLEKTEQIENKQARKEGIDVLYREVKKFTRDDSKEDN